MRHIHRRSKPKENGMLLHITFIKPPWGEGERGKASSKRSRVRYKQAYMPAFISSLQTSRHLCNKCNAKTNECEWITHIHQSSDPDPFSLNTSESPLRIAANCFMFGVRAEKTHLTGTAEITFSPLTSIALIGSTSLKIWQTPSAKRLFLPPFICGG